LKGENVAGQVFVSYSRRDSEYVAELVKYLKAQGIDIWVDTNLDLGDRWTAEIRTMIDTCAAFVVVMTPAAEDSKWVERELGRALDLGKLIIPVLLEGKPLFPVSELQYEDVTGGRLPNDGFVTRLQNLPQSSIPPQRPAMKHGIRRSTIRILCALCILLYAAFLLIVASSGASLSSIPLVVLGVAGLAAGVAAWALALYRAAKSHHNGWLAIIGFTSVAGGLPGFLATVVYAITGPADIP
jgi:hypothetical protein